MSFRQIALVAALLLQQLSTFADDVITNVMSPVVSFQFPENLRSQVLMNGGVFSTGVSYQYFEWPGDGILGLSISPRVSYYYPGSGGPQVILHGRVTESGGAALNGALVSVSFGQLPVATAS